MPIYSRRKKVKPTDVRKGSTRSDGSAVLDAPQRQIWPRLLPFAKLGVLGGGTALALQIGHRKSIDFDFFCFKPISRRLLQQVKDVFGTVTVLVNTGDELTFLTGTGVKITFVYYPFTFREQPILHEGLWLLPTRSIAATKAYTLNRRSEVKDYVDLYFLLKSELRVSQIIDEAKTIFDGMFSEKLFLAQLIYLDDISAADLKKIIFVKAKCPTLAQLKIFFEGVVRARL